MLFEVIFLKSLISPSMFPCRTEAESILFYVLKYVGILDSSVSYKEGWRKTIVAQHQRNRLLLIAFFTPALFSVKKPCGDKILVHCRKIMQ